MMKNIALRLLFILSIFLFVGALVYAGTPSPPNTMLVEAAVLIFGVQLVVFIPIGKPAASTGSATHVMACSHECARTCTAQRDVRV